jgi:DNA-binding winged helix-turn-helix (wHTH) protein
MLDVGERLLLKDELPVSLPPKAFDVLVVLVQNGGRLMSKDELMQAVWADVNVEEGNLQLYVSAIRKALGDNPAKPTYVETVPKWGYRFISSVQVGVGEEEMGAESRLTEITNVPEVGRTPPDDDGMARPESADGRPGLTDPTSSIDSLASVFGGHLRHALAGCALYALLYVDALFLEVAYQFDRLGSLALKLSPLVFLWVFGTAAAALWVDWRLTVRGKTTGLLFSLPIIIFAGVLLYAVLGQFLPGHAVTEAEFQTYPAQAAYLKSVYYFVPLAVVFLLLPYHFVLSARGELREGGHRLVLGLLTGRRSSAAPTGAVYLRAWWLVVALAVAATAALIAMAHLFESLRPSPHRGLFMQLAQWRLLLYIILGLECTVWYYWALNEIKRECLVREIPRTEGNWQRRVGRLHQ